MCLWIVTCCKRRKTAVNTVRAILVLPLRPDVIDNSHEVLALGALVCGSDLAVCVAAARTLETHPLGLGDVVASERLERG